jgi:hypothetical protein
MPVAMLVSVWMDLVEVRGMQRLEADIAALPVQAPDTLAQCEEPEPWDGLS